MPLMTPPTSLCRATHRRSSALVVARERLDRAHMHFRTVLVEVFAVSAYSSAGSDRRAVAEPTTSQRQPRAT